MTTNRKLIYWATLIRGTAYFYSYANKSENFQKEAGLAITQFMEVHKEYFESLPEEFAKCNEHLSTENYHLIDRCYNLVCNDIVNDNNITQQPTLIPVTETIKLSAEKIRKKGGWHGFQATPLNMTNLSFPEKNPQIQSYKSLWINFIEELRLIKANTFEAFCETYLSLLEKYTSHIPFLKGSFCDISLYDTIKMAGAFSSCINDTNNCEAPFLLIGADFSGIQNYIYQVISKYAGINLKGRSYYLRLLSDAVVRYLLKCMELPSANIIYNSGGGFYLLAPNTSTTCERYNSAVKEIEEHLYRTHGMSLFIAIDTVAVSEKRLLHQDTEKTIQDSWKELFEKRDHKKRARFAHQIAANYDAFFIPQGRGNETRDMITGEIIPDEEITFHPDKWDKELLNNLKELFGKEPALRQITGEQIQLGRRLKETDIVVIADKAIIPEDFYITPIGLGFYYYFWKKSDLIKYAPILNGYKDHISIITYNGDSTGDIIFLNKEFTNTQNSFGFKFYGGKMTKGKTFEEFCYAHNKENNDAFKRLGILRMDVDNLGSIFQSGIIRERANMARYSALSRSFDYFFSGYLNTLQKEFKETSYILYSGGDDLFIIGDWNSMIAMARRIHEEFKKYTCGNPAFSISGGIAILPVKYPVMKGAEESGEEETNAKEHICSTFSKNSISFMGYALNWDLEFPLLEELKSKLVSLDSRNILPSSFRSKILIHLASANITNHKINNVKTYWMLTYDLTRMKERINEPKVKLMIDICIREICSNAKSLNGQSLTTSYHPLELWGLACRWAELEIRSNK